MEELGLIYVVKQKSDHKVMSKGAKIFLADPSTYAALNGKLGNIREAYVVSACKQAGKSIFASSKEVDGDFVVDGKLLEVGGGKKKGKQADLVIRDDTERPVANGIPLWSLGMMY